MRHTTRAKALQQLRRDPGRCPKCGVKRRYPELEDCLRCALTAFVESGGLGHGLPTFTRDTRIGGTTATSAGGRSRS